MPKKRTTPAAPAASVASTHPPIGATDLPPAAHTVLAILDPASATTAAEAAERTGLGRSTVTKALAVLHGLGLAVRQEGGHEGTRRIADCWFAAPWSTEATTSHDSPADHDSEPITEPTDHDAPTAADVEDPAAGQHTPDDAPDAEANQHETDAAETGPTAETEAATGSQLPDPSAQTSEHTTEDDSESGVLDQIDEGSHNGDEPQKACEPGDGEPDNACTVHSSEEPPGSDATIPEVEPEPGDDIHSTPDAAQAEGSARLGKGELRAMVKDYLRQHPEEAFTSTQIHHVLQRSSGAIANACETLVKEKTVIVVSDKPRKFQWNSENNSTE